MAMYSLILFKFEGFSGKYGEISLQFCITRLTMFAVFYFVSSFLVLNVILLFLKVIVKVTVKLFSTTCLVRCQMAPPEAENLINLP